MATNREKQVEKTRHPLGSRVFIGGMGSLKHFFVSQ